MLPLVEPLVPFEIRPLWGGEAACRLLRKRYRKADFYEDKRIPVDERKPVN